MRVCVYIQFTTAINIVFNLQFEKHYQLAGKFVYKSTALIFILSFAKKYANIVAGGSLGKRAE